MERPDSKRDASRTPRAAEALFVVGSVASAILAACGGAKGSSNHEFTPTPNNPSPTATRMSEILPTTQAPTQVEATATAEAKILTFDEISQMVAEAYNTTQIPAGLCNLEQLNFMITNSKAAREAYDQNPVDFSPHANAYGRLVGEVQKIADATKSESFVNSQKELEESLIADMRGIASKRGFTEQDVQGFLATWRSNWLDRGSQNYDASRCGIVLPKH